MKSIAKPFIEYGPIVVFFIFFFKTGEIQGAIVPLMLAAVVAMVLSYIVEKKIPILAKNAEVIFLENKDNFTDLEWKNLYKFSEKTFVEETESLKKGAAGAGLTDNDWRW